MVSVTFRQQRSQSIGDENVRMYGSAVTVLNAPYMLLNRVKEILPELHEALKQSDKARSVIEVYSQDA